MKIIPYKNYLKKKKKEFNLLCPKCKNIELEHDVNITKKSEFFRKGHEDAIFECEGCRHYFVVLDYIDKEAKK